MSPASLGLVALGGAAGAVTRYLLALGAARLTGTAFPLGTWVANGLGCLLIGVAVPFLIEPEHPRRLLAVVGFLGAFTTFSSYSLETIVLWQGGRPGLAILNAVGSVGLGLVAVGAGIALGRHLAG